MTLPLPLDADARAVLESRARALALPLRDAREVGSREVVLLELAGETYAVESRFVFEAFRPTHVAFVPGAEAPVTGLTGWRGELLALLDLRELVGLPAAPAEGGGDVLVVGHDAPAFGLVVDAVRGVADLPFESVRMTAREGDGAGYLEGSTAEAVQLISALHLIRTYS